MTTVAYRSVSLLGALRARQILTLAALGILYAIAIWGTGFSIREVSAGVPDFLAFTRQMFPPDLSILHQLWLPFVQTIQIGVLATIIGAAVSIPIALLAAENTSPHRVIYYVTRGILNVCRGVSELIWALLFVVAVGLGPFAGVLALVIFSVGMIGKLLAEAIEAVDRGPLEALTTTGASSWKVFIYGVWPQIIPFFLSYSLYSWDHNTRQAAVLGFVGAGGLGYNLFIYIGTYEFEKATTVLLLTVGIIAIIDRACYWLRQRVI